eukprot:360817-Chlamydomonas_euryale.AAC.8
MLVEASVADARACLCTSISFPFVPFLPNRPHLPSVFVYYRHPPNLFRPSPIALRSQGSSVGPHIARNIRMHLSAATNDHTQQRTVQPASTTAPHLGGTLHRRRVVRTRHLCFGLVAEVYRRLAKLQYELTLAVVVVCGSARCRVVREKVSTGQASVAPVALRMQSSKAC